MSTSKLQETAGKVAAYYARLGKKAPQAFDVSQPVVIFQNPINAISSSLFGGNNQLDFQISNFDKPINNILLEVSINESGGSNPVYPTNPFFWFRRIEFYAGTNSTIMQTLTDVNLYKRFYSNLSVEDQKQEAENLFLDKSDITQPLPLKASEARKYYIPLPGNWMEAPKNPISIQNFPPNFFLVRLFTRNIVESGSGTIACSNIRIIFNCTEIIDKSAYLAAQRNLTFGIIDDSSQTEIQGVTPSTATNVLKLTGHNGLYSEICVIGRLASTSDTVTNGGLRKFVNFGDSASGFAILDSNQQNTIGGQPINMKYMRNYYGVKNYQGNLFTENYIYPYPLSAIPADAVNGGETQVYSFNNNQDYISLTAGTLGTAAIFTITPNATPASGSVRLGWKSLLTEEWSYTEPLAFNTNVANLKIALESLNTWPYNLSAVFSGVLTAAATVTLSGEAATENWSLDNLDVYQENSETAGGVGVSYVVSLTTPPVSGSSASINSALNILVTGQKHRVVTFSGNNIKVDDV